MEETRSFTKSQVDDLVNKCICQGADIATKQLVQNVYNYLLLVGKDSLTLEELEQQIDVVMGEITTPIVNIPNCNSCC